MAIYMQVKGIDGNVTAKGHEKWIEIYDFSFSVDRAISTQPGNTADREAGDPDISEIEIKKLLDSTTPKLFGEATVGKSIEQVKIDFVKTGDSLTTYMEYTLTDVMFSTYSVSADGGNMPVENLSLNFAKIEMKFTPSDVKDAAQSAQSAGYDLTQAAAASS